MYQFEKDEQLIQAARNNDIEAARKALENGADLHIYDNEALRSASENGHLAIVKLLLENGADLHAWDNYSLRLASENGFLEVVKLLLEKGALAGSVSIEGFENIIENDSSEGLRQLLPLFPHIKPQALLKFTTKHNSLECAQVLFELGAKPDMKLEMTDEMRDLFIAHQQKMKLDKNLKPIKSSYSSELNL